ncbi:hypothetical protein CSC71_02420 [Pseudoxanthomonas sangjuensis]|uniref:hypothetical protein n=1 Tax=Pseudoxanthomonas sangjuensis TaxID=1503750 RepID=UPI001391C4F6|nr:hypothetical protein [Pseudoxanthomonas sangjuensis]KAF1715087.1 hypothetical protein CSC71_02420 [Pseudoxanthomonas sangjuensis]
MRFSQASRPFALVLLAVAVAGASGCSWFKKGAKGDYALAPEMRPLEVPPGLTLPSTAGAMQIPAAAAPAASPSAPASTWFNVAGSRDETFAKLGDVLATIPGVTVSSKAQLLGVYDVSYEGVNFLVRVVAKDAGSYISAVDPRGLPASGEAPVKLVAQLKEKLGG